MRSIILLEIQPLLVRYKYSNDIISEIIFSANFPTFIRIRLSPPIMRFLLTQNSTYTVHSLLHLCGFCLRKIPFTRYLDLVPFLYLHINRSSVYTILGQNS